MIKRKTVAAVLSTSAFSFSIGMPSQPGAPQLISRLTATDAAADRQLQRRAACALAREWTLVGARIAAIAEAGAVTLVGVVTSDAQRARAVTLVAAVRGVRKVIDELELQVPV